MPAARRSSPTARSATVPGSATTISRSPSPSGSCRWCARTWRARASSSRSTPSRGSATRSSSPGAYGLGEYVVQGVVTPDEWTVFTPALAAGARPIIGRRLGSKEVRLVYADGTPCDAQRVDAGGGADALLPHRRRGADARPVVASHRASLLVARRPRPAHGHRVGEGRRERRRCSSCRRGRRPSTRARSARSPRRSTT